MAHYKYAIALEDYRLALFSSIRRNALHTSTKSPLFVVGRAFYGITWRSAMMAGCHYPLSREDREGLGSLMAGSKHSEIEIFQFQAPGKSIPAENEFDSKW